MPRTQSSDGLALESMPSRPSEDPGHAGVLSLVAEALRGLRFGTVSVIVQDGLVVQIDRIEKKRLPRPGRIS